MLCLRVRKRLVAYVDGELPEKARLAIEGHLNGCPGCRKVRDRIGSLNTLLNQVPEMDVPFDFSLKVLESLKEEEVIRPTLKWRPFRFPQFQFPPIPALVPATVAIIMFGVTFLGAYLGVSFPRYKKYNGTSLFQMSAFREVQYGSVENDYFELMLALHSNINSEGGKL